MEMEVVPHVGIGPVRLGMPFEDARSLAARDSCFQVDFRGSPPVVAFVQLSKRGWGTYNGIDLFEEAADDVVAEIARRENLDPKPYGPGRHSHYFPTLNMLLWRSTISEVEGEQGYLFDCVSLHIPNYYDRQTLNYLRGQSGLPPLPDEGGSESL